jgi:ankyrin repeat protein
MEEAEKQKISNELHDAVQSGERKTIERLLAAGADPDAWGRENRDGDRPLQAAARLRTTGAAEIVEALLQAGAEIDFAGDFGATALHRAVYEKSDDGWAVARLLVHRGANASIWDKDCLTPAEAAFEQGHDMAVVAMLEAGMPADVAGCAGPLLRYVSGSSVHLVKELLDRGADPNARTPSKRNTPLHRTAESFGLGAEAASEITLLLLEAGADPDAKNADGMTPAEISDKVCPKERVGAFHSLLEGFALGRASLPGENSDGSKWTGPRP